ncbi:expressed unknown protein [Seminavis robusta]|uniref:Uncharacterized protein n=1 Tax=Seminavis robusta TaxID=568900 RepID=A0A9N8HWM5_9STRA|nr:expressed unknown protein [Seminavis robusta]|eukprot:Sro2249_g320760.1 n/a (979) ;mRNA; r:9563-12846
MVATRLSEVFSKGYEWAYAGGSSLPAESSPLRSNTATATVVDTAPTVSSPSALWDAASSSLSSASTSLSSAADQAYNTLAGVANYAWESDDHPGGGGQPPYPPTTGSNFATTGIISERDHNNNNNNNSLDPSSWIHSMVVDRNDSLSPWRLHNPYNRVRGRYAQNRSSLNAVRSLLPLAANNNNNNFVEDTSDYPSLADASEDGAELLTGESEDSKLKRIEQQEQQRSSCPYTPDPNNNNYFETQQQQQQSHIHQNSETASQLAEGTVRALRDIALDEAVEFHAALRFWSFRWEHPLLSWLEAGPTVWLSRDGYDHQLIGQKVAKIQAVLARRCTAIGELQQHLLRAGWQRGVAQWGVLGHGGQWATVQGTYVFTEETAAVAAESQRQLLMKEQQQQQEQGQGQGQQQLAESIESVLPAQPLERIGLSNQQQQRHRGSRHTHSNANRTSSKRSDRKKWKREKGYYASVFVRNEYDGKILMDDATLAEWSVDAMELIRNLLLRASNGKAQLPYEHHWKNSPPPPERQSSVLTTESETGQLIVEEEVQPQEELPLNDNKHGVEEVGANRQLPVWAQWASKDGNNVEAEPNKEPTLDDDTVVISNLPLMAAEVSELLNSIEDIMPLQRSRRMRKLRPPSMFRRRWYLTVVAAPTLSYLTYHLISRGYGAELIKATLSKIYLFFEERVYVPFVAIIEEVWKGREDISDKKARLEVIAGLKEMIRSWLDDNHPEIPVEKRLEMAELMDISLIERKKAESMKTIYEINQAVRLSFIEMQFIKKEMVNALYTMDDMMTKNEINTNLAAVTPAVLLLYTARQVFRFFYYALLRLGKSKEETYSSFRHILTDIERLLVMRDNPPTSPFPHNQLRHSAGDTEEASQSQLMLSETAHKPGCDVLSADDLGMLMLHIHECRTILWTDYNRFTPAAIQSVSEDLAELAGERGAVSVQQQLQIIARMCRTYPFLKVISIGTTFHQSFIGGSH